MCIHPEALTLVKNFSPMCESQYHSVHEQTHNLPNKAQWMTGHTEHPSNKREKFALRVETEIVREGG